MIKGPFDAIWKHYEILANMACLLNRYHGKANGLFHIHYYFPNPEHTRSLFNTFQSGSAYVLTHSYPLKSAFAYTRTHTLLPWQQYKISVIIITKAEMKVVIKFIKIYISNKICPMFVIRFHSFQSIYSNCLYKLYFL